MARARRSASSATARTWRTARRWTKKEAQQAINALEQSGLAVSAFCKKHGLKVQRLHKWLGKLGDADNDRGPGGGAGMEVVKELPEPLHWVEAKVINTKQSIPVQRQGVSAIKVHLAGGQVIDIVTAEGLEPEWLARLAQGLSKA